MLYLACLEIVFDRLHTDLSTDFVDKSECEIKSRFICAHLIWLDMNSFLSFV